jgi:hypothetical protein
MKKRSSDSTGHAEPKKDAAAKVSEGKAAADQKRILELFGKFDWDDTYDYKAGRGRKNV